jgi:predicted nuclease of predicted toxin-antitoxin system
MNKFLVDECVDRKAIRQVPIQQKDFDVIFPADRTYKAADDASIAALAISESRILVTSDSDFQKTKLRPGDVPDGVLWFHLPRSSKKATSALLFKFCSLRHDAFASAPYDFSGQIIEITQIGITVNRRDSAPEFLPWPT